MGRFFKTWSIGTKYLANHRSAMEYALMNLKILRKGMWCVSEFKLLSNDLEIVRSSL